MNTRLTRRGKLLAAVAVGCLALGAIFGARSLNAVVAPAVVALAAGVLVVHRAPVPSVERTAPPDGHPGEEHLVTLDVSDCGSGLYELRDDVGTGLSASTTAFDVTDETARLTYDVRYDRRGVHRLGPVSIRMTDVLGLAERDLHLERSRAQLLVYPELVDAPAAVRSTLDAVVDLDRRSGRDEFDSLREYARGDSLRDVHWKTSAKRPGDELVVKEFLGRSPSDAVRIGVSPSGDRDAVDAAARATASVATTLLEEGVSVGVETPRETVQPASGSDHRVAILGALARLDAGDPEAADSAILITSDDGEPLVHAGGRSVPFSRDGSESVGQRVDADRDRRGDDREQARGVRP